MASTKPTSKATKKRKVADPTQSSMRGYLSKSPASQSPKDDPMQIDKNEDSVNVSSFLGTFRQQSLVPCISISNANPTRAKELPESFFKSSWETQKALVIGILSNKQNGMNINYVTASKLSESSCRYGKSKEIFDALKKEIERHVVEIKKRLLSVPVNQNLLTRLNQSWNTFCNQLAIIRNIFMELDRSFILPNTKFSSIIQLGKHIYSDTIMEAEQFRKVIVAEVLVLIKADRNDSENKAENIKLIQAILQMLIELSFYSIDFEPRFLINTTNYYKEESNKLVNELTVPDYIQHCYKRILEESNDRIKNYLDIHTKQALTNVVTNQLVYTKTEIIIKKGFDDMMTNSLEESLSILYDLLKSNSTKLNLLKIAFGEYIKKQGISTIGSVNGDKEMIVNLLKLKKKLDKILKNCFQNDVSFQNALKESFEHFINTRGNKPSEMLAKFIDQKVKQSSKKSNINNGEVDISVIDSALSLFRYIQGKDAFEAYYKRFLAKRLLSDRTISNEIENHILENLKSECGHEFTKNLENMFNDIQLSSDLNDEFEEFETNTSRMPLYVKVINQAIWPPFPVSDILLPREMIHTQKLYEKYYGTKYKGRTLLWQNSLSNCVLVCHFPNGQKDITATISQAVILLLFNNTKKKSISFQEMLQVTNLNERDLGRILSTISISPYNLIINENAIHQQPNIMRRTDKFKLNQDFTSPNIKLKLPSSQTEQAIEEQKGVEEKVFQNRQHQVDAAIVRIMKSKKTCSHNDLIQEITTQLNYHAEPSDIKKRIESLIDKDYLIRDTEDSSVYIYQS